MTIKLKLSLIFIGTLLNVLSQNAQAHLMAPYKGTLNFDQSGGYLVLSLPASTLMGFDKDKDRILTLAEIKSQQKTMIKYITDSLYLKSDTQETLLTGVMLAPQRSHDTNKNHIDHIVILGKFLHPLHEGISMRASLLNGLAKNEKLTITLTEKDNFSKHIFTLDSSHSSHTFGE